MPRGRDGPSRITIRRSCDTALSRAVIRTIAVAVPSAPDPGSRGNGTRSRRPDSPGKSPPIPQDVAKAMPAEPLGTARWTGLKFRFLDIRGRDDRRGRRAHRPLVGELEVYNTKRKINRCNETFARTIYLENFVHEKIAFN